VPELKREQNNSDFIEATPLSSGDRLDFNSPYASEDRVSTDTIRELTRMADEAARAQLDQQVKTPEALSIYPSLLQIDSIIEQMRGSMVDGMLTSERLTQEDFELAA
jgi:hypothetical protein